MQLFKNPEVKRGLFYYSAFTAAVMLGAFLLLAPAAALYTLVVCLAALLLFTFFTAGRYLDLADLSDEVAAILHDRQKSCTAPNREGEVAILANQIAKLTIRLQEQAEQLRREKIILRDSIADISHQIKTPLTALRMLLHRLMKEDATPEQRGDCVREMIGLLTRIEWLVMALLKIARLESGLVEFERCSVAVQRQMDAALTPLEVMMDVKDLHADIQLQEGASFHGDLAWTAEAVSNLLKNCIEHTPAQGALTIRAAENPLYTRITIADNGEGFAPEDIPHLFERFYKGRNASAQSIGIGLALSRMILKRQNATLTAKNLTPHGAEFILTFYKDTGLDDSFVMQK